VRRKRREEDTLTIGEVRKHVHIHVDENGVRVRLGVLLKRCCLPLASCLVTPHLSSARAGRKRTNRITIAKTSPQHNNIKRRHETTTNTRRKTKNTQSDETRIKVKLTWGDELARTTPFRGEVHNDELLLEGVFRQGRWQVATRTNRLTPAPCHARGQDGTARKAKAQCAPS
jgi:hypothetical protein